MASMPTIPRNGVASIPSSGPPLKRAATAPVVTEEGQESFVQRFVPDMVVERLFNGGAIQGQELSRYQEAVVGFFDVSGFSALARDLEQADKTRTEKALKKRSASSVISQHSISGKGAEELVRQLNQTLSVLIETIRLAGGDIIKFAGDAILVVWLCNELETLDCQLLRAAECAVACCQLKSDQSKLGLHVGIGCGELVAAHVGGTFGRWEFFIAGEACTQSALAEHHAGINQVVLSPQARKICSNSKFIRLMEGNEVEDGFYLLNRIQHQIVEPAPRPKLSLASDLNVAKAAEGFVPGPVRDALKSGGSTSASVGGLRKLTVIFFKLYDVNLPSKFNAETEKDFLAQCQNQARLVQDSAYHYYATLRQFILDDKGFVAIVVLGLPPFWHEDNAIRAVKVAKRLIEHHKVKAAAGICTGTVFCGVVGSSMRAEYSVAGSCINLAARLMAKAGPGMIWCDANTKAEAESLGQIRFEQFPSLPFKGFDQPVEIYGPVMATLLTPKPEAAPSGPNPEILNMGGPRKSSSNANLSAMGTAVDKLSGTKVEDGSGSGTSRKRKFPKADIHKRTFALVGMEAETAAISRAAFIGNGPPLRVCFLEGEAGAGKTRLAEWAMKESGARRALMVTADSSETNTPFFVWRSVLLCMLSIVGQNGPVQSSFADPTVMGTMMGSATSSSSAVAAAMMMKGKDQANASSSASSRRKRGFSMEEFSHPQQGPIAPPQPIHQRNRSHDYQPINPSPLAVSSTNVLHNSSFQKSSAALPQTRQTSFKRTPSTQSGGSEQSIVSMPRRKKEMIPMKKPRGDSIFNEIGPTEQVDDDDDDGLEEGDEEEEEERSNTSSSSSSSSSSDGEEDDEESNHQESRKVDQIQEEDEECSSDDAEGSSDDEDERGKASDENSDVGPNEKSMTTPTVVDNNNGENEKSTPSTLPPPLVASPPPASSALSPGTMLRQLSVDHPSSALNSNSSAPAGTTRIIAGPYPPGSTFVPDRSLVLEHLQESGKLRGRRMSSLHAILPSLIIPSDMDAPPETLDQPSVPHSNFNTSSTTSAPLSALFAKGLATPQRKLSLTGRSFLTSSNETGGGAAASGGNAASASSSSSGAAQPQQQQSSTLFKRKLMGDTLQQQQQQQETAKEPKSDVEESMEIFALLFEECALLDSFLVVIENAQYMDKSSWELLRKLCEMNPPSWKGEHRARFVVTYRPFPTPREHPLQMILQGPQLTSSGSFTNTGGGGAITNSNSTTTGTTANAAQLIGSPQIGSIQSTAGGGEGGVGMLGGQKLSAAPAFERVSSTLSALASHATGASRRRSMEGNNYVPGSSASQSAAASASAAAATSRASNSEVRSDFQHVDSEDPSALKVVINPFIQREAGVFLSNVYRLAIGPNLLTFLFKKSRGNPRALLECFKALQDQDLIKMDVTQGYCEEATPLEDISDLVFVVPMHLRASLQQQFDKLLNREQLIVKLASVCGSAFQLTLLKYLYKQRIGLIVTPQMSTFSSTISEDKNDEAAVKRSNDIARSFEDSMNEDLHAGLKELCAKGFLRPFSMSKDLHTRHQQQLRDESRDALDDEDFINSVEDWIFDSDYVRYIVYSQMLHTTRKEVHGLVLDWYASRPEPLRAREDPAFLGNHAIGAERPKVAFGAFREGLRRCIFKEEPVSQAERLWQSCVDLLEDPVAGFAANESVAYKIVVDVMMGQVCVQNESWNEAQHYLTRALEAYRHFEPTLSIRVGRKQSTPVLMNSSSWFVKLRKSMSCMSANVASTTTDIMTTEGSVFGSGMATSAGKHDKYFRDPLAREEVDIVIEARNYANLGTTLLKRIEDLQTTQRRMINSMKKFSVSEANGKKY